MVKVLANRLKIVLSRIISPTQSAFVSGHLISDNILVAYEIMHFLNHKRQGKEGFMSLKLDISKAYDRMAFSRASHVKNGVWERVDPKSHDVYNLGVFCHSHKWRT